MTHRPMNYLRWRFKVTISSLGYTFRNNFLLWTGKWASNANPEGCAELNLYVVYHSYVICSFCFTVNLYRLYKHSNTLRKYSSAVQVYLLIHACKYIVSVIHTFIVMFMFVLKSALWYKSNHVLTVHSRVAYHVPATVSLLPPSGLGTHSSDSSPVAVTTFSASYSRAPDWDQLWTHVVSFHVLYLPSHSVRVQTFFLMFRCPQP